jgi:HK97 family phage prohead protease
MFPVKNAAGDIDLAHLRNALARIPQASTLTASQRQACMDKAKAMAKNTTVGGPKGSYEGDAGSGRSTAIVVKSRERLPVEVMGEQTRSFALELRADGDGRTLIGRAVPYGQTVDIPGGKRERFVQGAFSRQIGSNQLHSIKLHASHSGRGDVLSQVGKTVALQEQPDGLHGAWQIYDTPPGDHVLHLVKTGEVTGLSIGFKAVDGGTSRGDDGVFERRQVHLDHVALTNDPVYADAQVMGVRSAHPIGGYRTHLLQARHLLGSLG